MNAKTYLQEIRRLEIKYRQNLEEINLLREQALCLPSTNIKDDVVQTSREGQGFTRIVERAAELERQLKEDAAQLQEIRHKRIEMINGLQNPKHIELLFLRYVLNKSMVYISDYIDQELGYTYNMHGLALQEFEKK